MRINRREQIYQSSDTIQTKTQLSLISSREHLIYNVKMSDIDGFVSMTIKLAAIINTRREAQSDNSMEPTPRNPLQSNFGYQLCSGIIAKLPQLMLILMLVFSWPQSAHSNIIKQQQADFTRHQTHYLSIVPSTHFNYKEGRQLSSIGLERSLEVGAASEPEPARSLPLSRTPSHIYKRSSALISSPGSHYPPFVGSMRPSLNPLSRRMMFEAAQSRWSAPQTVQNSQEIQQQPATVALEDQQLADVLALNLGNNQQAPSDDVIASTSSSDSQRSMKKSPHEEAELLRQKQHIQYHDQWPSMAGKCHKRTLNFCASVLPFNTTTFPNIIGDTNRFEVKRSLPFFGFLAKSSCNKRLDELLCLLLEPPCSVQSGLAIPPCKKFCRLALEGCNEYIPATLAMSSVFDCRQYPDSNDPDVCVNLAQGSKCASDEFKCPDKTCIPRNWLCDGVRDCIFAADEANCTGIGMSQQTSVCSTEEFKCDGKCVPKAWKCDGERDCLDGSDEDACDQRPRCGTDRFKCADGNGCIPKRWVCDGKAECRDGSDEINCEQLECSENDFKCDNGICIPKLWRCDRQPDCKDASDERNCLYPAAPTTVSVIETSTPVYANNSRSAFTEDSAPRQSIKQPYDYHSAASGDSQVNYYASNVDSPANQQPTASAGSQSLEPHLVHEDISRIIQQETSSTSQPSEPSSSLTPPAKPATDSARAQADKELKKYDYDIIQSSANQNLVQLDEQTQPKAHQRPLVTQIDFVPQTQKIPTRQLPGIGHDHETLQQHQQQSPSGSQQQQLNNWSLPVGHLVKVKGAESNKGMVIQRVPIYRSLFKTLKGGSGRLPGSVPIGHYRQGERRRREQIPNHRTHNGPVVPEDSARLLHWSSNPTTYSDKTAPSTPMPSQQQHQSAFQQQQSANQTSTSNSPQARSHGVVSYLQLLNSRYNLRLARSSSPPNVVS